MEVVVQTVRLQTLVWRGESSGRCSSRGAPGEEYNRRSSRNDHLLGACGVPGTVLSPIVYCFF